MTDSKIPTFDEIEASSKLYWGLNRNRENSFLRNYNNMLFLQIEKKHKIRKSQHRSKAVPFYIQDANKSIVMPADTETDKLYFNMMNENTNGFIGLISFMRFYRYASLYLELDSLTQ